MSTAKDTAIGFWEQEDGILYLGNCESLIQRIDMESIHLIIIDPPFGTGKTRKGDNPFLSYEDPTSVKGVSHEEWLGNCLKAMFPLLHKEGSILVHLNYRSVHDIKGRLDTIFGKKNFRNDIIWHYQSPSGSTRSFSNKHDNILWFTRSNNYVYQPDLGEVPRTDKALKRLESEKGARNPGKKKKNPMDVITHIPKLSTKQSRRFGYADEKPPELYEYLINMLTFPGDTVADLFCGSGATLAAARTLGRRWLGCDRNPGGFATSKNRLSRIPLADRQKYFVFGVE